MNLIMIPIALCALTAACVTPELLAENQALSAEANSVRYISPEMAKDCEYLDQVSAIAALSFFGGMEATEKTARQRLQVETLRRGGDSVRIADRLFDKGRGGAVTRMINYTADGNINTDVQTASPSRDYDYGDDGRLGTISANGLIVATYDYDAFEQRIRRIESGVEMHFVFSPNGELVGEYEGATGAVITEYIWLNDRLVGAVDGAGVLSFVQTGHLGQPLLVMDGTGATLWQGETTPFGVFVSTSGTTADPNLRFPGQWLEAGSGLYQNWHRDYDSTLGRYIEADPLGIAAGQSIYGYTEQDPLNLVDPEGLSPLGPIGFPSTPFGRAAREMAHGQMEFNRLGPNNGAAHDASGEVLGFLAPIGRAGAFGVNFCRNLLSRRAATKFTPMQRSAIKNYNRQIREHQEKIADALKNPTIMPGMEGLPAHMIRAQNQRRIRHLRQEIRTFRRNLRAQRRGQVDNTPRTPKGPKNPSDPNK